MRMKHDRQGDYMSCDYPAIERHILSEGWTSDEIYHHLLHLCDTLGHRFGGSESEHQAALFLQQQMEQYGLEHVHLEKFPMYTWDRGVCDLQVLAPSERQLSAIAMPYSDSGTFEGELIDVGEGEISDYDRLGNSVSGKIVLSDAETATRSHRTDKYRWAVEAGALAVVFLNRNPGLLHITGALYARNPGGANAADHEAPVPAVGVSLESGSLLRRLLDRDNVRLRLTLDNVTRKSHSSNVVGDVPGNGSSDEIIVFGGHYDGHDIAQGAADDAAGTLVGLEVGRLLAPFAGQLDRTVRIVCFGSEEIGLLGSWHHCDTYSSDGSSETLRFMMNLDGAGRGEGGRDVITATGDPEIASYFDDFADRRHYQFTTASSISPHSDHFPFFLKGYPSATLRSSDATAGMIGRGWGHTEADTVDKVSLRGLQMGAVFAARVAAWMACDQNLPFSSRDEAAVVEALEDAGLEQTLTHHWGRDNRADV